jgi:hypothetical protein
VDESARFQPECLLKIATKRRKRYPINACKLLILWWALQDLNDESVC